MEWRAVVGYEGAYEVSDHGLVRSITRQVPYGRHGITTYKGRVLKQNKVKNGYFTVKLAFAGNTKTIYVHELVLKAFVGSRPATVAKSEIRHLDGVKNNNTLKNLRYGTVFENAADRVRHKADKK